jgi:hypothetical protein
VKIDLAKPLERGRALRLEGKSYWVSFKYEKLPMFCFECGQIVHGGKGCPIPRRSRLSVAKDIRQWGVGLRVDDGRRRGFDGGSVFFNEEGRKRTQSADMGVDDGDYRAWSGDYRVGSMFMGSSRFFGNPRHVSYLLHGLDRGNPTSFNTENGGRWGKKDWADIEEVVEQLSVNQGDHEETHVSNVEVFSYTHVAAGNNNDAINGSGSLVGVHMVAVETEKQEVERMKAGGGDVLFQDVQCVHAVMGENEVECALSAGNVKENSGLGVETPHVVSHAHDVARGLVVGCGTGACYVKENEGHCGENAANVQGGMGEMEVEQLGPVGKKSL